jgi:uncharacterized protein YigE (DUF2233 family)
MFRPACLCLVFLLPLVACVAQPEKACAPVTFDSAAFTVCTFAADDPGLRLYLAHPDGAPYGQFDRLAEQVSADGGKLRFAMNAGMYHSDRRPVGHYVENGAETMRLITSTSGETNFSMLPNGVFWIGEGEAGVTETLAFEKRFADAPPRFATQSGPMLVVKGELHPSFNADGPSKKRRNGVGISADGARVLFAISDEPVNFHTFARLFRDELGAPDALFLDGQVSRLYAPEIDRDEQGADLGPIVAVITTPDS